MSDPLPFQPEPLDSMLARWQHALTPVYNLADAHTLLEMYRPGRQRKHVFDFDDGIRMIASIDKAPTIAPHLHLSFSLQQEGYPKRNLTWFISRVHELRQIFGNDIIQFSMHTECALHFWFNPPTL